MSTDCMWNYYRDELSYDTNDNNNPNKNVINSESFKYKTSITGSTYNVDTRITNDAGNQVNNPDYNTKKSGNFWRGLDISLINCEVSVLKTV